MPGFPTFSRVSYQSVSAFATVIFGFQYIQGGKDGIV